MIFLFATFKEGEDLRFFCYEHFPQIVTGKVQYILFTNGCIILLDSDKTKEELTESIEEILDIDDIHFYLVFEKDSLFFYDLPPDLEAIINNGNYADVHKEQMFSSFFSTEETFDIDTILDKIKNSGIESLTDDEKNFLENFEK